MTWPIRFTPLAESDVAEAYADYEAARSGLGEEFLRATEEVVSLIGDLPEACPKVHGQVRRALLHRFPYSLYYRIDRRAGVIEVRGVIHQRRHPSSWHRRA